MLLSIILVVLAAAAFVARYRSKQVPRPKAPVTTYSAERVPRPRKRGRAKEQIQADQAQYACELRKKATESFEADRERALYIGSKKYIWRTSGDSDVCDVCAKNSGKRFFWRANLAHGHPGECDACPSGHCRCYAEAVVPD